MRLRRDFSSAMLCLSLAACETRAPESAFQIGKVHAVSTPADTRIVTERSDPDQSGQTVICSEPSPDVAKAFSSIAAVGANTPRGGVQGAYGQGEAVSALAGRTATAVALRDSLFRACEAYANGVIGKDAYSLILSHYPDLLVALMLGEQVQSGAVSDASVDLSVVTKKVEDAESTAVEDPPSGPNTKSPPRPNLKTTLEKTSSAGAMAATHQTAGSPVKLSTPNSAAAQIASYYFATEQARGNSGKFVVCLTEAEKAMKANRPFPDMIRNNFIDRMCQAMQK